MKNTKNTYLKRAGEKQFADISLNQETIAMLLQYFDAMNHLYNLIPLRKVLEIINSQNAEPVPEEAFIALTETVNDCNYHYYFLSPEELYDDAVVSEPFDRYLMHESLTIVDDVYEEIVRSQIGKSYYIPEKETFLKFADDSYHETVTEGTAILDFFRNELHLPKKEADELLTETQDLLRNAFEIDRIFTDYARMGTVFTEKQISDFIPLLCNLANNTRTPYFCGHTPNEVNSPVKTQKNASEIYQACQKTVTTFRQIRSMMALNGGIPKQMMKMPSKNGPCPCGSGKKYKRCCGKK